MPRSASGTWRARDANDGGSTTTRSNRRRSATNRAHHLERIPVAELVAGGTHGRQVLVAVEVALGSSERGSADIDPVDELGAAPPPR